MTIKICESNQCVWRATEYLANYLKVCADKARLNVHSGVKSISTLRYFHIYFI